MKGLKKKWLWIVLLILICTAISGGLYYIQTVNSPQMKLQKERNYILPTFENTTYNSGYIQILNLDTARVTRHKVMVPAERWEIYDVVPIDDHTVILRGGYEGFGAAYYYDLNKRNVPLDLGFYAVLHFINHVSVSPNQKYFAIDFIPEFISSRTNKNYKIALFEKNPLSLKSYISISRKYYGFTLDNNGYGYLTTREKDKLSKWSLKNEGKKLWEKKNPAFSVLLGGRCISFVPDPIKMKCIITDLRTGRRHGIKTGLSFDDEQYYLSNDGEWLLVRERSGVDPDNGRYRYTGRVTLVHLTNGDRQVIKVSPPYIDFSFQENILLNKEDGFLYYLGEKSMAVIDLKTGKARKRVFIVEKSNKKSMDIKDGKVGRKLDAAH